MANSNENKATIKHRKKQTNDVSNGTKIDEKTTNEENKKKQRKQEQYVFYLLIYTFFHSKFYLFFLFSLDFVQVE